MHVASFRALPCPPGPIRDHPRPRSIEVLVDVVLVDPIGRVLVDVVLVNPIGRLKF